MTTDPNDEETFSRRRHRQAAIDALVVSENLHDAAEMGDIEWERVRYWQRDGLIHALLALSAD